MQELDEFLDARVNLVRHCGACNDKSVLRLRSIEGYAVYELINAIKELEGLYKQCLQNRNK